LRRLVGHEIRCEIYPAPQRFERRLAGRANAMVVGFKGFLSGENGYSEVFLRHPMDVNGDGWPDVVVGNKKGVFVFLQK